MGQDFALLLNVAAGSGAKISMANTCPHWLKSWTFPQASGVHGILEKRTLKLEAGRSSAAFGAGCQVLSLIAVGLWCFGPDFWSLVRLGALGVWSSLSTLTGALVGPTDAGPTRGFGPPWS